jgi:hypothetical protein
MDMPTGLFAVTSANQNSMLEVDFKWLESLSSEAVCRCGRVLQPDTITEVFVPKAPRETEGVLAGADIRVLAVIDELMNTICSDEVGLAFQMARLEMKTGLVGNWTALIPGPERQLCVNSLRKTVPPGTSGCKVCKGESCYEAGDFYIDEADWPCDGDVFSASTEIIVSGRVLDDLKKASGFRKRYGIGITPIERLGK